MFRKISFALTLFASLLLYQIASADQLVIEKPRFRQGFAFTLTVDNREACLDAARNYSNLNRTSNYRDLSSNSFYMISFTCFNSKGIVTGHGTVYQVPFSSSDRMCLSLSSWNGFYIDEKKCPNELFSTRAVILVGLPFRDYVTIKK